VRPEVILLLPEGITDYFLTTPPSLPINSFPTPFPDGDDKETGIGDFNIFAAYLMDTDPGVTLVLVHR